jgi:hypothetical protein
MSKPQNQHPETPNTADYKVNPIIWAKRENKIVYGDVNELNIDSTDRNIRFQAGTEVFGVQVKADTYDLDSIMSQIRDQGYIREPIWVSVRKDGSKWTIRGNRRTRGGQMLLKDGTISADLREALTKRTPMMLFHGLTPEQESELVFDQDQKRFLRSEIARQVFQMRKQGNGFESIALKYWEPLGEKFIKPQTFAEVRAITDPNLKTAKIKTSYRGTVDCYLLWGYDLGAYMQKQIMLSEMRLDGLIGENDEQPYFFTTKNSQKRIAKLREAKNADGSKFTPLMLVEGTEFKKVCDEFHKEDYGITVKTPKTEKKTLGREAIVALKDGCQSRCQRAAFERVLGDEAPDMTLTDERTAILEAKLMLVDLHLPKLKPEVAAVVRQCLVNVNPLDFQKYLEANCVAPVPVEPTVPTV